MMISLRLLRLLPLASIALVVSACDAQPPIVVTLPTRPFLLVANQRIGAATLVELTTGRVTNALLDARPHEVALSPNGRQALLTVPMERFGGAHSIFVVDLTRTTSPRHFELREIKEPHGVQFLSDSIALIGDLGGTAAAFVDTRSGQPLRTITGLPENPYIVSLATTGRAYISSPHSSKVSEVDVASGKVQRTFELPDDPAGITVSPDGRELYAAIWRDKVGGGILIYDLVKGAIAVKLPATLPRRMTITPDGKHLVVSDRDGVVIVDRATRGVRVVPTVRNSGGSGVACSTDSTRCYVPLSQAAEIVEIDVVNAKLLRRFPAQQGVDGLVFVDR